MHYNKGNKKAIGHIKKGTVLFLLFAVAFLPNATGFITPAYGAVKEQKEDDSKQSEKEKIYFKNSRVEAGVPLTVINAPKGAVYHWTITSADGKEESFTTKKNSYTPSNKDMEKLISVSLNSSGETSASIYFSSLPVIYITYLYGYYNVRDNYFAASMRIQENNTFSEKKELYNGDINIKLRGNSTKLRQKRPFNIKLDKKTNLLGMGKNKHWALLANDIDHTLMRNKLLYDFSGAIGMENYIKSENVVVIFNNEYQGVYQLSELVDVGSHRVNVYDWEESAEDAAKAITSQLVKNNELEENMEERAEIKLEDAMCQDLCWITSPYTFSYDINGDGQKETYKITDYIKLPDATGGVLMEMDFFAFKGDNASTMISDYSMPWYFKSPEYAITNKTLFNYIDKYVQSFEYALHSTDFTYHENSTKYMAVYRKGGSINRGYKRSDFKAPEYDGKHYSELFDMDSLVQNFIVCEYAMNWDGMKNSVFMYKDTDGLFHMGPEWDFDWVWGNTNMFQKNTWYPKSWHTTEDAFVKEQYYQTVQWNRCLIRDPYFLVRVFEKYKQIRKNQIENMIKKGGTIDTLTKALEVPAAANDAKWSYTYSGYKSVGFKDSVNYMKKFIRTRLNWMDKQFESLDTFIASLGYYQPDDDLKVTRITTIQKNGDTVITAKVKDFDISKITFQVNGTNQYTAKVKFGTAVCHVPKSTLVKENGVLNVVQILAMDSDGKYIINSEDKGNYSLAKSNYAVFHTGVISNNNLGIYYIIVAIIAVLIISFLLVYMFKIRKKLK